MKKLFLVAVMSLGSLTAFAQDAEATEAATDVAVEAEAAMTAQDEFTSVDISEVPAAITEALANDYPGVEISEAYVNEEAQYKLEVAKEDGTTIELYADSEGNWLEM